MAYTAYKTWTVGEVLTAANMNAQVRDNGLLGPEALATADGEVWIATGANAGEMVAILDANNRLKHEYGGLEFNISAVAQGGIPRGTGSGTMGLLAGFLDASDRVKHEYGGLEFNISAVAQGGIPRGTGSGTMGLLAAFLDASDRVKHEKGGLESDVSAGDGFVEIKSGATTVIKSNTAASAAPGVTDDSASGYAVGSIWLDTTNDKAYICLDATASAAVWLEMTLPAQATQAEIEGESNVSKYVPPDLIKHSPGVAKGWCRITAAGALVSGSYNVSSITDVGTGDRDIVWDVDFSSSDYVVGGALIDSSAFGYFQCITIAVGSVELRVKDTADLNADLASGHVAFGDQ